jgi:acyl carrier protein
MTKVEFLRALESQLEVPEGSLNGKQAIRDLSSWDSMAGLLFIALADEKLGVIVSGDQIARSKTIDDLMSLLGDRLTA